MYRNYDINMSYQKTENIAIITCAFLSIDNLYGIDKYNKCIIIFTLQSHTWIWLLHFVHKSHWYWRRIYSLYETSCIEVIKNKFSQPSRCCNEEMNQENPIWGKKFACESCNFSCNESKVGLDKLLNKISSHKN